MFLLAINLLTSLTLITAQATLPTLSKPTPLPYQLPALQPRRQLSGTVGELILTKNQSIPKRGGKCFDSWECSWYYHTRHPGFWGDCDQGTCLCQPGYTGAHCQYAPPANRFSCSDGQCYIPTVNGRQSEIRGGNLTVTVVKMINLPDTDGFGVFGGETDAFVEIQIGKLDEFGTFVELYIIILFVYIYSY